MNSFFDNVSINPIIASINDLDKLDIALQSPCEIIFLLTGNIFNLKEISNKVTSYNKSLYIYIDLIDGFSKDTWGLEYIIKNIQLDGVITSKQNLVKLSKDMGVFTIYRMFIPDSKALKQGINFVKTNHPHAVEILPGPMPKVLKMILNEINIPLIASGLIMDMIDLNSILEAGALAISTSNDNIWHLDFSKK